MARNGSGTYSKVNTFVAGNSITAAGHNQNWDDLVTEMTNSVAADGQTTITGALKGSNGAVGAPAYSFASDLDTGIYRIGANNIGISAGNTKIFDGTSTNVTIPVTINSVTLDNTAWTAFTPTLSAGSGSITTSSASGRYKQIGKLVNYTIDITITSKGTAAGLLKATVPVAENATRKFTGVGTGTSGSCTATIGASAGVINILYYNGTFIFDNATDTVNVTGTYEAS